MNQATPIVIETDGLPETADLAGWAEDLLDEALKLFGEKEGWKGVGGYCVLADSTTGMPQWVRLIGTLGHKPHMLSANLNFPLSAAGTLAGHPEHVSTFQHRDAAAALHLGAIRSTNFIFAFYGNGIPELLGEAMMLVLAVKVGDMEMEAAAEIAALSQNPYFATLAEEIWKLDSEA